MHEKDLCKFRILIKVQRLKKYLSNLKARNFAIDSSIVFAEDLEKILIVIEKNIERLSTSNYLNFENFLDRIILEFCSFIERSTPSYIPWSFLNELEKICKSTIDSDIHVVLKSDLQYNYTVHNINLIDYLLEQIKNYFGDLTELDKSSFRKTRIFTIPLLEKSNAILHSILFHEIGHHYHSLFEEKYTTQKYLEVLGNVYAQKTDQLSEEDLFTITQALEILKGAVREIYSDIFAFMFCGLSIVFALKFFYQKFPVLVSPHDDNDFYPPLKYRIRILMQVADEEKTIDFFQRSQTRHNYYRSIQNELDEISSFLSSNDDLLELQSKPAIRYAYKAFELLLPEIKKDISERVGTKFQYSNIHEELFDKLEDGVPPCEVNDVPQKLVDILLAGWAAYFNILQSNETLDIKIMKSNFINNLVLKAITQSNLMEKYRQFR